MDFKRKEKDMKGEKLVRLLGILTQTSTGIFLICHPYGTRTRTDRQKIDLEENDFLIEPSSLLHYAIKCCFKCHAEQCIRQTENI